MEDINIHYELVRKEDILLASTLCARSFLHSPLYYSIFRGTDEWRLEQLTWFFNLNINMIYELEPSCLYGTYDYTNQNKPKLISFYLFCHSNSIHPSLWDKLKAGLLLIPFRCGYNVFTRLLTTSNHFDAIFPSLHGNREHFELQRMVVDPDYQGKGIGSKSLSQGIKKADELGLPIFLTTQLEINTKFYKKLGFVVVREEKFSTTGLPQDECDNWVMVREPQINNKNNTNTNTETEIEIENIK